MVRLFFVVPVYDPCLCGITAGSTLTTNFFPPSHSEFLRQHRTIPALRLKHRSGSCGTAAALPKCSIMSGCGTRHRASGAKAPRTLRPLPLLRFAVSATGGAHLCSIQYYLRFWLGICRTSLAVSALRIMRCCPRFLQGNNAVHFPHPLLCSMVSSLSIHRASTSFSCSIKACPFSTGMQNTPVESASPRPLSLLTMATLFM